MSVFEEDMNSGMKAEDINVKYDSTQDYPEELIGVRCSFSSEITINNYSVYKAATETSDTAKLMSVNFLE